MEFFSQAMNYEKYKSIIQDLSFPIENIGRTWLCRDIYSIKIGTGPRKILYVGPHKANEWMLSQILINWIFDLEYAYLNKEPFLIYNIRTLCEKNTIYVIPMINADGVDLFLNGLEKSSPFYERVKKINKTENFLNWQANIRGVDLDLNYNAAWVDGKMNERERKIFGPSPIGYGGEYPESELETASLCYFTRKIKPDIIYSFHNGNKEIYCDFKGDAPVAGLKTAHILSKYSGYNLKGKNENVATGGGYKNWVIDELSIPAIDIYIKTAEKQTVEETIKQGYKEVKDLLTVISIV